MKNVLLLVHDDEGQEARLQAALDLTRALDGHLSCVDVTQIPALMADYYTTAGGMMLLYDEREQEARNKARTEARLTIEDVPWDWVDITGDPAASILQKAKLADVIMLNTRLGDPAPSALRNLASDILTHARKPVIAVPQSLQRFEIGGRALIAWDGSAPVAATMRACVPLLKLASDVHLFSAGKDDCDFHVQDAAAYLSRHDIHADIRARDDDRYQPSEMILQACDTWHADWCLMGAYSHSRIRELLFGGVTRRMLAQSRIPVVLGH